MIEWQQIIATMTLFIQSTINLLSLCIFILGFLAGMILHLIGYLWPLVLNQRFLAKNSLNSSAKKWNVFNKIIEILKLPWISSDRIILPIQQNNKLPIIYRLLNFDINNATLLFRYIPPWYEILTATITLFIYYRTFSWFYFLALLIISYSLVILCIIDKRALILPDEITLFLVWLGLGFNLIGGSVPLYDAVIGAIVGYLSFWLLSKLARLMTGKIMLGQGDFKLFSALGACLGWQWLNDIVIIASLLGIIIIMMTAIKRGLMHFQQPFPFGSCLAISGLGLLLYLL